MKKYDNKNAVTTVVLFLEFNNEGLRSRFRNDFKAH